MQQDSSSYMMTTIDPNQPPPPLIYSVSLAVFDLHVGNTMAYTYPKRKLQAVEDNKNSGEVTTTSTTSNNNDIKKKSSSHSNSTKKFTHQSSEAEPVHPTNVIGGARLHDYCFPDGGHDVSSDEVSFLVRLKEPLSPFLNDENNVGNQDQDQDGTGNNDNETTTTPARPEQQQQQQQEDDNVIGETAPMTMTEETTEERESMMEELDEGRDACEEPTLEESSPIIRNPNSSEDAAHSSSFAKEMIDSNANLLTENLADALGAAGASPTSAASRKNHNNNNNKPSFSSTTTSPNNNSISITSSSQNDNNGEKKSPSPSSINNNNNNNTDFGYLSQPIPILYGSALYVRAADPNVERGALQRSIVVLSRVPLQKSILEFLRIRALPILSDAPNFKNDDPRLKQLVDEIYRDVCEMTNPCVSSYRIVTPLFAELDAGKRIYLPRVGRYNSAHHPASHLVLLGYRSSVTNLLRLLGPTHSALLLYAILARIPVMVIGKTAKEVCRAVCACIHLCRPLPIGIGHFAPYAPISVLDKLIAQASTTPFAVVGATNAFVAHKSFKGIVKLLLPSIAEEVLASSAASGDEVSASLQKKASQSAKERRAAMMKDRDAGGSGATTFGNDSFFDTSNNGDGFAFVQYPTHSNLHKVGPAKFLPNTFSIRVKRLVAFANEPDASEAHLRALTLALNFALSLEIRTCYGDVGKMFNTGAGLVNVISSPLRDMNHHQAEKDQQEKSPTKNSPSQAAVTTFVAKENSAEYDENKNNNNNNNSNLEDLDDIEDDGFDADFEVIASNDSVAMQGATGVSQEQQDKNNNSNNNSKFSTGIFPALRSREEEARLVNSLEMALRSFVTEKANERNTVFTVHKWFTACRTMLLPVAECSSSTQKMLFDDLMPTFTTLEAAVRYDLNNLHNEKEDVGMLLTCEDMLLTLGEQQRLCRIDLGRFVEHYRRRAGASIDMLCSKQNSGARSRHINSLFCDNFSLPGIECYELQRETLLAQASAEVTVSPCETYTEDENDSDKPPAPFWENVEVTLSLSSRFICLNAAEQSIASKAMSKLSRMLPKSSPGKKQTFVNDYYAQQVFPIAAVARIEVLSDENDDRNNDDGNNILKNSANALANNIIPSDLHTIRLHLHVASPDNNAASNSPLQRANSGNFSPISSLHNTWRAKLDIRVSQRAGISQLLFLLVNKHHDFSQAIRRMSPSPASNTNNLSDSAPSSSSNQQTQQQEGFFIGNIRSHICPVALSGPSRLRDVPQITRDDIYENQRFYPIVGWSSKLMPHDPPAWSDRSGLRYKPKDGVVLPPGYEWAGEWALVPYYDELKAPDSFAKEEQELIAEGGWEPGEEAWAFGTFWSLADFHAKKFPICSIRRRRWVRQRRFKPELMARLKNDGIQQEKNNTANSSSSSNNNNNQQQQQQQNRNNDDKEENEVNNSLAFASRLRTLEHISDVKASLGEIKEDRQGK